MVVFFFRAAVETFVAAWMSKSVSLSSSSLPPTTKIKFWEFLGKPHNFEGKKTFWHFFLEKLIWNNEKEFQYDWKHRDATRPCFFCGLFCGWIKKRCQRQIIYFSRRSVIKVFAPTPQTAFLRSPITVEIIIIGQQASPGLLSMTRKNAKQDMSQLCGKCCQAGEFENHLDQSGLLSASLGTSKVPKDDNMEIMIRIYGVAWKITWVDEIVNLLTYNWWDVWSVKGGNLDEIE